MMNNGHTIRLWDNIKNFDENKFLKNYKNYNFYDFQGSTWAPTIVHRDIWNSVGGLVKNFSWYWFRPRF